MKVETFDRTKPQHLTAIYHWFEQHSMGTLEALLTKASNE